VTPWDEPAPGERESAERSWPVVRAAWAEREPLPRPRRDLRPLLALAAALAVVAAALSPPGTAVLRSLRRAIAVTPAHPLAALPAPGRLLVNSPAGAWVVQRNGSKRLLGGYADASWSPHGRFLVAARGGELVALEPGGKVHWSLARPRVGAPVWSSERLCCRIAYAAGDSLRVVGGDGAGDRLLVSRIGVTPTVEFTWRPGTRQLAYVDRRGRLRLLDLDRRRVLWSSGDRIVFPQLLRWSDDGRRLLAVGSRTFAVFRPDGSVVRAGVAFRGTPTDAAYLPRSHRFALSLAGGGRSVVRVLDADHPRGAGRRVFGAAGTFGRIAWSPNGRWLLVAWTSADEWLFVRSAAVRKATVVTDVAQTFEASAEAPPVPAGWVAP
jgi:hypothetical protein